MARITNETWIKRFKSVHGEKYRYAECDIKNNSTKIEVYCMKCESKFWPTPANHYNCKTGCPKCSGNVPLKDEEWIKRFQSVHGEKYGYEKCEFKTARTNVKIYCRECKKYFNQSPDNHDWPTWVNFSTRIFYYRTHELYVVCGNVILIFL